MTDPRNKLGLSEAEWKARLTPEQYRVLRQQGTERAFTGEYTDTTDAGVYRCAACDFPLFESGEKFHSGCGWPSYSAAKRDPEGKPSVDEIEDTSHGMVRTEVTCTNCGSHLGHVFPDGPPPTGLRYCINSVAVKLQREG
ncbi:MAG: peptide-methionine (R)-S-oxide reductase MsrB [Planctomycetota bacterium]